MGKKRSAKKMSANAAARVFDFGTAKRKKQDSKYTQVKPIKKLTCEQMKSSMDFKRDSWERD